MAQALQNLLSGGFPALIDDDSAHFHTSQPIRQDSWQLHGGTQGGRWGNPGVQSGGTQGGRGSSPGEQGGGTPGSKVEVTEEQHETTRETQWGDFCKAVRELACCSALRR